MGVAHSFRLEVMVASNDSWSVFSQHWSARAAGLANSNNKLVKERTVLDRFCLLGRINLNGK